MGKNKVDHTRSKKKNQIRIKYANDKKVTDF